MSTGEINKHSKFKWRVENVMKLSETHQVLELKRINGFPWKFTAFNDEGHLSMRIWCMKSDECPVWECEVTGDYHMKVPNYPEYEDETVNFDNVMFYNQCFTDHLVVLIDDDLKEMMGNDGSIEIELNFVVKGRSGERFRKWPQADFFSPSQISDVILIAEGKRFYASKHILALASTYFKWMFFNDENNSQKKEVELENVSADAFLSALEVIYDTGRKFSDDSVESLLMIAHQYDIPKITNLTEHWMMYHPDLLPEPLMLLIADRYQLRRLLKVYLDSIDDYYWNDVTESVYYKDFSIELKDEIIKKMSDIQWHSDEYPHTSYRHLPRVDFFSPSEFSDLVMIVEGKQFFVSKKVLANASPYFEALFLKNFKESQEEEIEWNELWAADFLILLKLIYDSGSCLSKDNVEGLLMIADVFIIPKVINLCEAWLLDSGEVPHETKVRLSVEYRLHALQVENESTSRDPNRDFDFTP